MQLRQYSLAFFATTLLVALTDRSANAISLAGSTQGFLLEKTLPSSGAKLTVTGEPVSLLQIPSSDSAFITTLSRLFPKWTFTLATSDLPGQFYVDLFLPNNTTGVDKNGTPAAYVGADFKFHYIPSQNASLPQPNPDNLHWIQRVTDYNLAGRRGTPNNFIDVPDRQLNPFYDLNPGLNLPNKYTFEDGPHTSRAQSNSTPITDTFKAQVYLVEKTAPRTVTIYDGLAWSWQGTITGSSGGGGGRSLQSAKRELPILDTDSGDTSQIPQAVPESDSALGILAIGGWFGATWFSKRNKSSASLTDKPKIK